MQLLSADSVKRQERAVRQIGTCACTGRYDEEFFDLLVTPLHGLAATSDSDGLRIMAISARSSIGTDAAIGGLRTSLPKRNRSKGSLMPEPCVSRAETALCGPFPAKTRQRRRSGTDDNHSITTAVRTCG